MYRVSKVAIPQTAFGKRAPNSLIPNTIMLVLCIQKNMGGFSQKGWKLMYTRVKSPSINISREHSAKLISSQSKRWTLPRKGMKKTAAAISIAGMVYFTRTKIYVHG